MHMHIISDFVKGKGRLLVTGASGFIGRHIVASALAAGYEVTAFSHKACRFPGAKCIVGDINDGAALEDAVNGIDYVVHLAGITVSKEFEKDARRCYDINVNGFINAINSACRNAVKKFIYASTSYVYLDNFREDAVIDIDKQTNHYAKSKLIDEMIAQSYEDIFPNTKIIGIRYFNVYGEGEETKGPYTSIVTKFLDCAARGEPLELYGDGSQSKDLVNVEDAAKITLILMQKGKYPIYNVGTGQEVSYKQVAMMINPKGIKYIPNPLSTYQTFTRADTARLLNALGPYKFIDLKEWLKKKNHVLR